MAELAFGTGIASIAVAQILIAGKSYTAKELSFIELGFDAVTSSCRMFNSPGNIDVAVGLSFRRREHV
jgi:hypothetical protein